MVKDMVRLNMDRCIDSNILSIWIRNGDDLLRLLLESKKTRSPERSFLCSFRSNSLWIFKRNHYLLVPFAFLRGNGDIN